MTPQAPEIRICTETTIARPVEQVFDFATSPGYWPRWHPNSDRVSEGAEHSLEVGEQVTEDFRVGDHIGRAVWTVLERKAPHRWVIEGSQPDGSHATITYTFAAQGKSTAFRRELIIDKLSPGLPQGMADQIRRRLEADSRAALEGLKKVLEGAQ